MLTTIDSVVRDSGSQGGEILKSRVHLLLYFITVLINVLVYRI